MYYVDDPDQLPELPDPGPRDGRHGVDNDASYDPYPPVHFGIATGLGPLRVSVADASRHLAILVDRVENGDDVVLTDRGHDVARLSAMGHHQTNPSIGPTATTGADDASAVTPVPREFEGEDQLPALPDPGPRDGRHGVDGTPPIKRRGQRLPR
ncbi:type II toxin-antitoxin system Phd/YefM family antitoxin [Leifsonia sp. A12D58]|uniref:type II toxin-antitoxin system Phd/YefM family antitoxin n=1 Tax=Leifsonia sp. A12D58 TaxID=3397674 RepID=UPI0039DFA77B